MHGEVNSNLSGAGLGNLQLLPGAFYSKKMIKLYRININTLEDPLRMKGFWNRLDQRRKRSSGIPSRMTEKGVWAQEL